jgi:hypothetical protein
LVAITVMVCTLASERQTCHIDHRIRHMPGIDGWLRGHAAMGLQHAVYLHARGHVRFAAMADIDLSGKRCRISVRPATSTWSSR